jgi:hypothetical protein
MIQLAIDVDNIPQPTGSVGMLAGEKWQFQTWFRDNLLGITTSNFSDAVSIELR